MPETSFPDASAPWTSLAGHRRWLSAETDRLLDFTDGAPHPGGGFAWLADDGTPVLDKPVETWITTRMTHVAGIGQLLGRPGCAPLVDHGIAALRGLLADPDHGGWFAAADRPEGGSKRAYEHAFVILAASTAAIAQRPGAADLLHDALDTVEAHFWDEARGVVTDVWTRDWSEREPYGGANANMHTVEAFLAAADARNEPRWRERALRIASFFIDTNARAHNWRIPEHFDVEWNELPDYNRDAPAHPFRPYGATIGHGFEWARLCLHLHASLGDVAPAWLVEAARGLFDRAMLDGWNRDGNEGFVYTTDWDGNPVVDDHLHWVVCEQIAAAAALHQATGEARYEADYRLGWDHAARHFIDRRLGSWHSQLDRTNRPSSSVWAGKPDTYHAFQATLLPRLPLASSIASGVARGLLSV